MGLVPVWASAAVIDNGSASPNLWLVANNWDTNAVPGLSDDVIFDDSLSTLSGLTFSMGTDGVAHPTVALEANSLAFGSATASLGAFTLQTNAQGPNFDRTLTINTGGIWVHSSVTANHNINSVNGVLTLAATDGSFELSNAGTGTLNIGAIISGLATTVTSSAGNVTLGGANTYTGATSVTGGVLRINNASTFANTASISIASGARLDVGADTGLSKVVTGGGVGVGRTLRYSAAQTAGNTPLGSDPGTILGTVEVATAVGTPGYTLNLGGGSVFANGSGTTGNYGGLVTLSGNSKFLQQSANSFTVSGSVSSGTAGTKVLTLDAPEGGTSTLSGALKKGSGDIEIIKVGKGTWVVSDGAASSGPSTGNADISGKVTLREGYLRLMGSTNVAGTTLSSIGSGVINVGDLVGGATGGAFIARNNSANILPNNINFVAGSTNDVVGFYSNGGSNQAAYGGTITADRNVLMKHDTGGTQRYIGTFNLKGNKLTIENSGAASTVLFGQFTTTAGAELDIYNTSTGTTSFDTTAFSNNAVAITLNSGTIALATTGTTEGKVMGTGSLTMKGTSTLSFGNTQYAEMSLANVNIPAGASPVIQSTGQNNKVVRFKAFNVGTAGNAATANFKTTYGNTATTAFGFDLGPVTLLGDATFNVTQDSTALLAVNIGQGITGDFGITKTGSQALVIGGTTVNQGSGSGLVAGRAAVDVSNNDYTGDTTITGGSIRLGATDALPTDTKVNIGAAGTLDLSANAQAIANVTVSAEIGGLNDTGGAGGTVVGNTINVANTGNIANRTLTLGGALSTYSFSGTIIDKPVANATANSKLALLKKGAGTQELKGASTYSGGTTINEGILKVNNSSGSATGTAAVVVDGASATEFGTLGGRGSVAGALTLQGYGHLAPGNSAGILTAGNGVTFGADTTFDVEIDGTTAGGTDTAGTNGYDRLAVTAGDVALGGTLALDITYQASGGEIFYIIDNQAGTTSQTFAGLTEGATVATFGGYDYKISYDAITGGALDGGNDVAIYAVAAVPEPTSIALIGLIGAGLLGRRRRLA